MKKFFSLTRFGIINLKGGASSKVQCAGVNHHLYKYGVGVLYAEGIHLDHNGWLIDNNRIDAAVQKSDADSCEMMLKDILDDITSLLKEANIQIIGIKVVLRPTVVIDEKVAEFNLCGVEDERYIESVLGMRVEIPQ